MNTIKTDEVEILIVDDQVRNLDALEVMLEGSGCTLVRAQSAEEALLAILRHDFAAMILDIRMPGMSGIELANLVKQRRRTENVPILFLTAHLVEDEDVLRGYRVGAVDYLSKPIKADILRSKVGVFVELYRKTRELGALNHALQREIAERQSAQDALQQMNQELELRVAERTALLSLAHRGVKENEERLRMAMEVARIAAWDCDVETGQTTWSRDPEGFFGFPGGAFGPQLRILDALHPDDRSRVHAAIRRAVDMASHYECEYRAVRPDGVTVWIAERGRAVLGNDGRTARLVGVSRDVSEERRTEQERERLLISERRARDEAERQGRIKDEFLATLSHELRTPMNAILGWLSLLAKGDAVKDPEHAMGVIQRNAQIQAKLIEDLLEMTKLTSGTVRLDLEPLDVAAAVGAAIQAVEPAAESKGVHLASNIEPGTPEIRADARRIQQILWNLLHNAVKFTPRGGRVDVSVTSGNSAVQVLVKDTGQGIPAEFLPYVFDRFRQADPSATRGAWGLGIGLSIARHLAELHGGSIQVTSTGIDQGSTFTVHLPVTAADRADRHHSSVEPIDAVTRVAVDRSLSSASGQAPAVT